MLPQAGEYLRIHAELWLRVARALVYLEQGDFVSTRQQWQNVKEYLWKHETVTESVLDCYNFNRTFREIMEQEERCFN